MAQSSDNRSHLNLLIMLELLKKVLKLIHNPLIIQIDGFRKMESKCLFITLKIYRRIALGECRKYLSPSQLKNNHTKKTTVQVRINIHG